MAVHSGSSHVKCSGTVILSVMAWLYCCDLLQCRYKILYHEDVIKVSANIWCK